MTYITADGREIDLEAFETKYPGALAAFRRRLETSEHWAMIKGGTDRMVERMAKDEAAATGIGWQETDIYAFQHDLFLQFGIMLGQLTGTKSGSFEEFFEAAIGAVEEP